MRILVKIFFNKKIKEIKNSRINAFSTRNYLIKNKFILF